MRNNKQDKLTQIRIVTSILKLDDNDLKEITGYTYKQMVRLNYDELKTISKELNQIYKNNK